mgnify:CR=1 FL=1
MVALGILVTLLGFVLSVLSLGMASSVSGAICFCPLSRDPKRTTSMSRYSSIDSSSSRRLTKWSVLRISRRSRPDSLMMSIRAVSGCVRMSDEMDVSVLKRKCGLTWAFSARNCASRACSSARRDASYSMAA